MSNVQREAVQGYPTIPSGDAKSGSESTSFATLGTQTIGPRWTGESYDVIRIDLNPSRNLTDINEIPFASLDDTVVKKKRTRIEFSTSELDSVFASLGSATGLDAPA
jgi:hypothetical protein